MDPETIFHDTAKVQERCKRSEKTHLLYLLLCELTRSEKTHANPSHVRQHSNGQKRHIRIVLALGSAHDQKRHMPLSCKGWKHPSLTCAAAKKTPFEAARSCDQKRHTPPRLHFCYAEKKKYHSQMRFHSPCARVQPLPAAPGDALHPTAFRPGASPQNHRYHRLKSASCKGSKHSTLTACAARHTLKASRSCDQKRHTQPTLHGKKKGKPQGHAIRKDTHNQDSTFAILRNDGLS